MKTKEVAKLRRAVLTVELENGQMREIVLSDDRVCAKVLDAVAETVYVDDLGGVGINATDCDFHYILGDLPDGWPAEDGRIRWCTAGPFDETQPQIWAFPATSILPPDEVREGGQDAKDILASIFIEEDGRFTALLHVKVTTVEACQEGVANHAVEDTDYTSLEEARAAVTTINDHLDGKCELAEPKAAP